MDFFWFDYVYEVTATWSVKIDYNDFSGKNPVLGFSDQEGLKRAQHNVSQVLSKINNGMSHFGMKLQRKVLQLI